MRRGYLDVDFLMHEDKFAGVCLGWDHCAEHEWGIPSIQHHFGLTDDPAVFGLERRKVCKTTDALVWGEVEGSKPTEYALVFSPYGVRYTNVLTKGYLNELRLWDDQEVAGAWDMDTFGVLVTPKHKDHLAALYGAFQRCDVAVYLGGKSTPFSNRGLCLVIASRLPAELTKEMHDVDEDYYHLEEAAKATGIEEYLKSKGKRWFALSPRWADEGKTSVKFWLNPMDQHIYEEGWFTVADLKEWAADRGPVMMKRKVR